MTAARTCLGCGQREVVPHGDGFKCRSCGRRERIFRDPDLEQARRDMLESATRPFVLTLRWTCQACGWEWVVDAPGFAGDGHLHYPDGVRGCGPITAQKADGYPPPRDATPTMGGREGTSFG
jgi:hypothetical protein